MHEHAHLMSGAEIAVVASAFCSRFDCRFLLAADFQHILKPSPGLQTLAVWTWFLLIRYLKRKKEQERDATFLAAQLHL